MHYEFNLVKWHWLKTWHILRKLRCCPGAPDNSQKPSTYCRSAKQTQDEKGSMLALRCTRILLSRPTTTMPRKRKEHQTVFRIEQLRAISK
jgi:hypothetical protein